MKIFKYILICLFRMLYCFIIVLLLFLLAVPHLNLLAKNIEQLVNSRLPQGVQVSGFSFSQLEISIASIAVRRVHFELKKTESSYAVSADGVFLSDVRCLVTPEDCHVFAEGFNLENQDLKVNGAAGDFVILTGSGERALRGSVAVDSIGYKEYMIEKMYSDVRIMEGSIIFDRMSAHAYQGLIKAEGSYQFFPEEKIEVALDFKDIDTHTIDAVNHKWKGVVEGSACYTGTFKRVDNLTLEFRSSSSEMERTLLKYLMGDVGNSLAFLPFAKILESADFIHLDKFQGTVHNLEQDSVSVKLNLESKQLNLNLNPDITINLR